MVKREHMGIQVIFRIAAIVLCLWTSASGAWGDDSSRCFDFSNKVTKSLREPIALKTGEDAHESGKRDNDDVTWASMRGVVDKSIQKLVELLLDHDTTKSPKVDEMEVIKIDSPHYLARHDVKYLIKPFPFVKIRWTEEWGYALEEGSATDPKVVVISYHKSEGTSHIERLCGTIILRKNGSNSTDVYQYEEAKATQREVKDTLNGLAGTLKTLRK